jgi:hypothetical protein
MYTCMWCFVCNWFGQKNSSEPLIKHLKYFQFCTQIRQDTGIFMHSLYYPHTLNFIPCKYYIYVQNIIPRIISIWTILCISTYNPQTRSFFLKSNCTFSVCTKFHSAYSYYILNFNFIPWIISSMQTISFLVLSAYTKLYLISSTHSACYQYVLNLISHIIRIC